MTTLVWLNNFLYEKISPYDLLDLADMHHSPYNFHSENWLVCFSKTNLSSPYNLLDLADTLNGPYAFHCEKLAHLYANIFKPLHSLNWLPYTYIFDKFVLIIFSIQNCFDESGEASSRSNQLVLCDGLPFVREELLRHVVHKI